jgi:BlaI family transcriptional regulator, penicillinase repressor
MARPGSKHPTEGELAILKVLWEQGPSRLSDICTHLSVDRKPAPSTVATMLKIMKDKGLVQRVSPGTGVAWQAKLTQKEAGGSMLQTLMNQLFEGSAQKVVLQLLEGGKLSRKDQEEIRKLLTSKHSIKR